MKSSTQLAPADFTRLIKQANLTLSDDEKAKIHDQLADALEAVKVLKELDTTTVNLTTSVSGLTNVWREDVIVPSFPQETALQNAPSTHNGFFMVPAIFEAQDN